MPKKSLFVPNGTSYASSVEFISFTIKVHVRKYQEERLLKTRKSVFLHTPASIIIPKPIREALDLQDGDFIEVAIRRKKA